MKRRTMLTKVFAGILCAVMLLGTIPFTVFAESGEEFKSETHTVFKNTETTLAPGVTQNIKYAYAQDGNQMVYYVATADVTRDDVVVQTSYYKQHEGGVLGMQKLMDQAAYANQKYTNPEDPNFISEYYNVVAGTNASFYHMGTGQPMGITFIDGISFGTASYDNFFAILKDGKTAVIDYASNLDKYVDENGENTIWQAAAGSAWLVRDGVDVTANSSGSYNTDRHSRTCVGVTADGKVVLMALDGRQVPFSCGGSLHELAQIMLEAGCVAAVNLDGGGSTTFISRPAGSDELQLINRPSDGSERSISSGLLIASIAAPSNAFESAVLTPEHDYVTPESTVTITATGVSTVGTSAQIPAEALWQVQDPSMGTVVDGTFVSSGAVGDAVIQMTYQGETVGETTVHVAIPEIAFASPKITVPYDTTFELDIIGTTNEGLNRVTLKAADIAFELEPGMGSINGLLYTTCPESAGVTGGTITAKCVWDETKTASVVVSFGKASEILWDFEDAGDLADFTGNAMGWPNSAYRPDNVKASQATAEDGKVHDGSGSLRFEIDVTNMGTPVDQAMRFQLMPRERKVIEGAQAIGAWVYLPNELWTPRIRFILRELNDDGTLSGAKLCYTMQAVGWYDHIEEGGNEGKWVYFRADIDSTKKYVLGNYADLADNLAFFDFQWHSSAPNSASQIDRMFAAGTVNGKYTVYVDSIQVDYSDAIADREVPEITDMVYLEEGETTIPLIKNVLNTVECEMLTINSNILNLRATIREDTSKTNYTGLDYASAKILVDGVATPVKAIGEYLTLENYAVADGVHRITFVVADKQGNETRKTRWINVQSGVEASTITLTPADPTLDKLLNGSLYWVNLNANQIETIKSVSVVIDKNSVNHWELEHMIVAEGFTAAWCVDDYEETATITLTRTGENTQTGAATLAQLPIRIIDWDDIYKETEKAYWDSVGFGSPEGFKAGRESDGQVFAWPQDLKLEILRGEITFVDSYTSSVANTFANEYFRVDTLWYKNPKRIYAEDKSYDWLHIHTLTSVDDAVPTCTEEGHSGRTYCEGCKSIIEWGESIPAKGHNYELIDEKFVCSECSAVYETGTGLVEVSGNWYYSVNGKLMTGWRQIDDAWYFFDEDSKHSVKAYENGYVTFEFEDDGRLISGQWYKDGFGTKYYYGPDYYKAFLKANYVSWVTIDGKTYNFNYDGYRSEGVEAWYESGAKAPTIYCFSDDGVLIGAVEKEGLVQTKNGDIYFAVNGVAKYAGLVKDDENNYYYISGNDFKAVKNCNKYITYTNGLLPAGTYTFGADGRIALKQGIRIDPDGEIRYYVNDVAIYAGLVQDADGSYYYITGSTLTAVKNCSKYITYTNGLLPAGTYTFGADGKIILKQGITKDPDGEIRYYVDNVAVYAGLVQDADGAYYYITGSTLTAVKNCSKYITYTNGLLPAGTYTFGADGRIILRQGLRIDPDGEIRYYVDDVAIYAGLVQDADGAYYYITGSTLTAVKNCSKYITYTNGLLPAGTYTFGADGKLILKQGITKDPDGEIRYYVDNVAVYAGLVQDADGSYYYITGSTLTAVKSCSKYITYTNGLLPAGTYTFGADGKMLTD